MKKCGGCGREIDTGGMGDGVKFLCARCYHMHITGPGPPHTLGSTAFLVIAAACLVAVGLAGSSLCILYLVGTGDTPWFVALGVAMLIAVALPAGVLILKRNLALLIAAFYLPLGAWALLWYGAPGVDWGFGGMTAYGGFFFAVTGIFALFFFVRDLRGLPRL
jgi:hypothetical protein